jgi:hypothetical protein
MRLRQADSTIEDGERPLWLLSMELPDGRVLRLASRPLEVRSAIDDLGPFQFDPFLTGVTEFEAELDYFSLDGVGALTQARVEISSPGTDLASLQSDWYHVAAASVELALLWEGQTWEDRLVVLEGGIQEAELGLDGEGSAFTLETTPPATSDTVGDDERDVGTDWPVTFDTGGVYEISDLTGRKYVYVYGAPESIPGYKVGAVGGNNRVVLCGHEMARTGASYQVEAFVDGESVGTFTVANGTINGKPYAYIDDFAGTRVFEAADGAVTWKATYGGIAAADGVDRPALNAEGVIRRLLVDSGLRVDWRLTEPALARLRDWKIGLWTDQEVAAIDLLRDRVFPHLPIVEIPSGSGLWLAYGDPHQAEVEAHLTVGQELLGRVGRMRLSDSDAIRDSFTLNYAYDAFSETYTKTARLDATNSSLCMLSQQLLRRVDRRGRLVDTGVRAADPIDCDVTSDDTTALRILGAKASRLALQRRILDYEVAPDAYWLQEGMVVTLTDAERNITRQRAVISVLNRSLYPFTATFQLVDRTPMSRGA